MIAGKGPCGLQVLFGGIYSCKTLYYTFWEYPINHNRLKQQMKYLSAALIFLIFSIPAMAVEITEDNYAGAPHFIIKTKKATYYLDKQGGGLSRLIDRYGNDWISFKRYPWEVYPESAASSLRGLPSFVNGTADHKAGHPGHNKCLSYQVDDHTILTITKSGKWQWRWKFYEKYATITMEKLVPGSKYWFLYQGPVAGEFSPPNTYWGTSLGGPRRDISDMNKGGIIFGNWQWVYFGDNRIKQVLFLAMKTYDRRIDAIGFLGNSDKGIESESGMVVFGFGRQGNEQPLLTDPHNTFYIGFLKEKVKSASDHEDIAKAIEQILKGHL